MTVGFSGTRQGMTEQQNTKIHKWLQLVARHVHIERTKARHGVCVGSDAQFHELAREFGFYIIGHPGIQIDGQEKDRDYTIQSECDELMMPRYFLERNKDIVSKSHFVFATPAQKEEQFRGSGTWQVIRYVKSLYKTSIGAALLCVVYPDGSVDGDLEKMLRSE